MDTLAWGSLQPRTVWALGGDDTDDPTCEAAAVLPAPKQGMRIPGDYDCIRSNHCGFHSPSA
ncbi:hypothetical protein SBDP1_950038 [Syntrophobacter sp. SbD1]|nr:hypothetical protein SBDP1_950038 [Syntrophobacter sp. SbD1]